MPHKGKAMKIAALLYLNVLFILFCLIAPGCVKQPNQTSRFAADSGESLKLTNALMSDQTYLGKSPRTLGDFAFAADLTQNQIIAKWGQPDGTRGSGISYKAYALGNGQEVWVSFLPDSACHIYRVILVSDEGNPVVIYPTSESDPHRTSH
jgi:hypothetical protein